MNELPAWLSLRGNAVMVDCTVVPGASRTRIVGVHDGRLKIQLMPSAVEGKANDALVRLLAKALKVPTAQVEIVGGPTSRKKTVRLADLTPQRVLLSLSPPEK